MLIGFPFTGADGVVQSLAFEKYYKKSYRCIMFQYYMILVISDRFRFFLYKSIKSKKRQIPLKSRYIQILYINITFYSIIHVPIQNLYIELQ